MENVQTSASQSYTIERITPEMAEDLFDLSIAAMGSCRSHSLVEEVDQSLAALNSMRDKFIAYFARNARGEGDKKHDIWTAIDTSSGKPIAMIDLFVFIDPTSGQKKASIYNNYVDPNFQKNGVAKALLAQAEAHAVQQGVQSITLDSTPNALQFYMARGYEPDFNHPEGLVTEFGSENDRLGVIETRMIKQASSITHQGTLADVSKANNL